MSAELKMETETQKDWRVLEFFVPIEESVTEGQDFIIRGVAINETTTLNNVKYVAEELEKAAVTFRNVPILLDHKNEVRNIVGRTTERVDYNPNFKRIDFEGKIMDKGIKEMIKDGRIGSVSIGAKVNDLIEEDDGSMKAIGIHGLEISLVAVPGDAHANLAQAIQQGFHLKEMAEQSKDFREQLNKLEDNMAEDEVKTDEVETKPESEEVTENNEETSEESEDNTESEEEKVTEEKIQNINVKVDTSEISEMKKQISELKEMLREKKVKKEEIKKDSTKGEVSMQKVKELEQLNNAILERAENGKGFAIYRDYSKESLDTTNLKRLAR